MRAMVLPRFGGPELLEMREVERPEPGPGEILVRIIAASVNPVDAKIRALAVFAMLCAVALSAQALFSLLVSESRTTARCGRVTPESTPAPPAQLRAPAAADPAARQPK